MNKTVIIQQDTLGKECTIYDYSSVTFQYRGKEASTGEYLKHLDFEELPGAYGLLRFFRSYESRLAFKFAVLLVHEQNHLFLIKEFEFAEFMNKWACLAPVLPEYLPGFDGQVMTKKLF
jgi:hypothetical protein